MLNYIQVGSTVQLLSLPDWLIHDLPIDEQREMFTFIGKQAIVEQIDSHGYVWIGFGSAQDCGDTAHCSGHSFGVPASCLQLV
ncbi:hypothetical protein G7048_13705 [Diaphorobacter sp. HDW4B]|uniref:hypothetical protein n=1 Tax=Diaphorobacter sp. HDW4B TaxID=2714925 RepID=UPI00140C9568|nr:hypothetical protein [Diaphorobacter sp. HDW4B]QIL71325.1 hypothetical protein G7048_13705 [Diaphorobacter sp. HDW4B]